MTTTQGEKKLFIFSNFMCPFGRSERWRKSFSYYNCSSARYCDILYLPWKSVVGKGVQLVFAKDSVPLQRG